MAKTLEAMMNSTPKISLHLYRNKYLFKCARAFIECQGNGSEQGMSGQKKVYFCAACIGNTRRKFTFISCLSSTLPLRSAPLNFFYPDTPVGLWRRHNRPRASPRDFR